MRIIEEGKLRKFYTQRKSRREGMRKDRLVLALQLRIIMLNDEEFPSGINERFITVRVPLAKDDI